MARVRRSAILAAASGLLLAAAGAFSGTAASADEPTPAPATKSTDSPPPVAPNGDLILRPENPGPRPGSGGANALAVKNDVAALAAPAGANGLSAAYAVPSGSYWWSVEFDNSAATVSGGEPRSVTGGYYLSRTMWAKWKAPATGTVWFTLTTGDAADDTGLNVYTSGTSYSTLKLVASNDQQFFPVEGAAGAPAGPGPSSNSGILSMKVTAGGTYYFQVGSISLTSSGNGVAYSDLHLQLLGSRYLPANDDFVSASELKLPSGATALTIHDALLNGATMEEWEPSDNDESAASTRTGSIWYKWTAPQNATVDISDCASLNSPSLAVFGNHVSKAGAGDGDLEALGFDWGGYGECTVVAGGGLIDDLAVAKGSTYYVQVAQTAGGPEVRARAVDVTLDVTFLDPYISAMDHTRAKRTGGATVVISGVELDTAGTPIVKFGSKTAKVVSHTATSITVTTPAVSTAQTVDVTVTSGGSVSNRVRFSFT